MANTLKEALADRWLAKAEKRCVKAPIGCGLPVGPEDWRDSISLREYEISALCQKCQDSVFIEPPEDEP